MRLLELAKQQSNREPFSPQHTQTEIGGGTLSPIPSQFSNKTLLLSEQSHFVNY